MGVASIVVVEGTGRGASAVASAPACVVLYKTSTHVVWAQRELEGDVRMAARCLACVRQGCGHASGMRVQVEGRRVGLKGTCVGIERACKGMTVTVVGEDMGKNDVNIEIGRCQSSC